MSNMNGQTTRHGYSTGEPNIRTKQKREDDLQEAKRILADDLREFINTKTGHLISEELAADFVVRFVEEVQE